MRFLGSRFVLVLACFACALASYTSERPVKLLSVGFFAKRFPAPESEFRVDVSKGEDVDADTVDLEEANGMPGKFLMLYSGGCATYVLPVEKEEDTHELYLMVQPGKKEDEWGYFSYENKGNINLKASVNTESQMIECDVDPYDSSPQASDYCMLNISSIVPEETKIDLGVEICVPDSDKRDASLWELWVSQEDDSTRAKGTFTEDGRTRMRQTQDTPDFNTYLTMTSIVGKTGVGKSTVASFLAGNMSMFATDSSSTGTTTVGTDVSPIIPSYEYITVLDEKLREGEIPFNPEFYVPDEQKPLFFMDSEGMSFRGDEFDFITSGPSAIISKAIIWITTGRLQPPDLLADIRDYLKGLDRISMGDGSVKSTPKYGEFYIVLNKMQDTSDSDEKLLHDLMGSAVTDNERATVRKLKENFEGLAVIGLPYVQLEAGQEFGYSVLPTRFREGLMKMANNVLRLSNTPRVVEVGSYQYEMNSTEAETIISMLTDAANSGNIDLTDPCNVLGTVYKERINKGLRDAENELMEQTSSSCSQTRSGVNCSQCVCPYRNIFVEKTKEAMMSVIEEAVDLASLICADLSVASKIQKLAKVVENFVENNNCHGVAKSHDTSNVCDMSEMNFDSEQQTCDSLFMCGSKTITNKDLHLIVNKDLFIDKSTTITITAPPKARSRVEGDGNDGHQGEAGKTLTLTVNGELLTGSEERIEAYFTGGDGGDGGNGGDNDGYGGDGKNGEDGKDGDDGADGANGANGSDGNRGDAGANGKILEVPGRTHNCKNVYDSGSSYGDWKNCEDDTNDRHDCHVFSFKCWATHCHKRTYDKMFKTEITSQSACDDSVNGRQGGHGSKGTDGKDGGNGGNGGNGVDGENGGDGGDGGNGGKGGNGGNGGEAGYCVLENNQQIYCIEHRTGGNGGIGGVGGKGGKGGLSGNPGNPGIPGNPGKGGYGGLGGHAGHGGTGGLPGHGQTETATAKARIHIAEQGWCSGAVCKWGKDEADYEGCENSLDYEYIPQSTEVYCPGSHGAEGQKGETGRDGRDGRDGIVGKAGNVGHPGKQGHDGHDGEHGTNGIKPAQSNFVRWAN